MRVEWLRSDPDALFTWAKEGEVLATLQWSREERPFLLEWIGPNNVVSNATADLYAQKMIAAIFGPPGAPGKPGKEGPVGPIGPEGKAGNAQIPEVLDGGNF